MIRLLLILIVLLLGFIGFCLLRKTEIFLALLKKNATDETQKTFYLFGYSYLFMAAIGIIILITNQLIFSLFYICILLIISTVFSMYIARKIL
ncbi:hypothetical protein QQG09_03310 [Melissococcus plutonius]|uniref:DUF3784 domain-containing protein n=1 Tax=Melissococcus plutonius TaxID=33970 RepID=A0A2Z5Y1F6_9ENTE|nr:hypothetical protein [Melissococcus plutonius]BAL61843.1 hypothetical protein MPD5_0576 [Melissococcus plutonius DAT561]MCV2499339.1 hypothetical protein [Melissococcus plutonius]MCV2501762.1 hypothetical protein [Melissococcus plutonius]MCV2505590.1 hypothetical protein [Melissococcus plutonius]MCV2507897.1 hypothetical protein [Melissococcus plutonius]